MPRAIDTAFVIAWMQEFNRVVGENRQLLTDLDAVIGDGDHGINMDRGMTAVVAELHGSPSEDLPKLLKQVGLALVSSVGGASGALYGTFFLRMAAAIGKADVVDESVFAGAIHAGVDGVVARGHAHPGDKTMIDALAPALDTLHAALAQGTALREALPRAAAAAEAGRDATTAMLARKGRASYLGQRSVGHQDPGATSAAMLMAAAASVMQEDERVPQR